MKPGLKPLVGVSRKIVVSDFLRREWVSSISRILQLPRDQRSKQGHVGFVFEL